jgi:hypothetical protein
MDSRPGWSEFLNHDTRIESTAGAALPPIGIVAQ